MAVAPRRWPVLPVESPQECGTSNWAEVCPENALCVQTLNNWCACKEYQQKPGCNGREIKTEYGKKYAEYGKKYAEYGMKYAEYGMKYAEYAEYDNKYEEYVHCNVAVSHCDVFNMLNMVYNMQNMLFNM